MSNKGIIESILRKVDSSITIVDVDKLRSNNDRMNNHIEKMKVWILDVRLIN